NVVVGLLGNKSPDSNKFTLVTPKSENDVRLQVTLANQNPTGLPVGTVRYVQPVLNEYLSDLSNEVYKALSDIPETKISKFYSPGSWLPHITIGKTLDKEQMQAAFLKLQNSFTPMQAKITELGLSSVNPHTDIIRKKLKYDLHA
ncbi:hypothetical protein SAMN05216390_1481, partial [Lachnospiraceae bacterium KH1T2]